MNESFHEILKLQKSENDRLRKIISEKCEIIEGLKKSLEEFTSQNQVINEKFQSELDILRKDNEKLPNLLEMKIASLLDKQSLDEKLKMHAIKRAKIQNCVKSISSETNRLSKQLEFYKEKTEKAEQELKNTEEKFVENGKELKLNEDMLKVKMGKLVEQLNEKNVELNKVKHELDLATKSNFDQFVYMSSLEKRLADKKSNVMPPLPKPDSSSSSTGRYFCEPCKVMVNSQAQFDGYKYKNRSSKPSSVPLVAAREVKIEVSADLPEADPSSVHFCAICKIKFNSKRQLDEHKTANHKPNYLPYFKNPGSIPVNRARLLADSPASQLANHPTNLFAIPPANPFFQPPENLPGNLIFKPPVYNFQDANYFDPRFANNVKWF